MYKRLGYFLSTLLLISSLGVTGTVLAMGSGSSIGLEAANFEQAYAKSVTIPVFTLGGIEIRQSTNFQVPAIFQHPENRKCRPFCIQPDNIIGAKTIRVGDIPQLAESINQGKTLLLDLRSRNWFKTGTIPGAIHFPYHNLFGANAEQAMKKLTDGKDVIVFCNGWWCHQSPTGVLALKKTGYAGKIYYFRGGIQDWVDAGLALVKPK